MPSKGFLAIWIIAVGTAAVILGILAYNFLNYLKLREIRSRDDIPEVPALEDSQVKNLKALSGSDELNVIESELNSTNVDNLDAGLSEEVAPLGF